MKVKLWTWNSLKEDMEHEANKVFDTDADLVVTCQTEAKENVHRFASTTANSTWQLISYAKHTGFAGGERNSQILNVFLRAPKDGKYEIQHPPDTAWNTSRTSTFLKTVLATGTDQVMKWSRVDGVVDVVTQIHQTSNTGKGGASAKLVLQATPERQATTVMFLCAHLDSQKESKRNKGLVEMFSEMRPEIKVDQDLLVIAPCMLFDANLPECRGQVRSVLASVKDKKKSSQLQAWLKESEAGSPTVVDSVIVFGDLNYRVARRDTIDGQPFEVTNVDLITSKIVTPAGRQVLSRADPLKHSGNAATRLIQPASESGFSFRCNQPFESYIPSYKMKNAEACKNLGEMRLDAKILRSGSLQKAQTFARDCYTKAPKKNKARKWSLKGEDELQLGWLDRACFRSVDGSNVKHQITLEEGFTDSEGSDHMPVAVTLQISNA